jgi:hypothetical protein
LPECSCCEHLQHRGNFNSACRQRHDNEVGQLCIKQRAQLAGLRALAGDEAEFFQSLSEELSNVLLAVGDANARFDFSPAERSRLDRLFGFPHGALLH